MSKLSVFFDRIDISTIFAEHKTTFYHYEKKRFNNKTVIPFSDKVLFFILPFMVAVIMCICGLKFNKDYVNIALTCLSIFTGLLFGLLPMVFNLIIENQKIKISDEDAEIRKRVEAKIDLTKHLFINIGFSIVLSILSLILVLLTQLYPTVIIHKIQSWEYYEIIKQTYLYFINGVCFFLIIEFILTLLMIIRRFTILFINETEFNNTNS